MRWYRGRYPQGEKAMVMIQNLTPKDIEGSLSGKYHVGTPLKATGDCHQWVMKSWHRNSLT